MTDNMPRLLFIDDQQDFLDSMSFWMRNKGYHVTTALDGLSGIEVVKKGETDIVFCDFKMPGLNGVETIRRIRQIDKTVPVVLVTSHADEATMNELHTLNISGFFSKMGHFDELEQVLEVVIRNLKKTKKPTE